MLKYLYVKEVFTEIPGEISLAVSITGCLQRCPGCHSRELWEDKGIVLGLTELQWLLNQHQGITCLLLMGGEHDIDSLIELFKYAHPLIKTAWYCGLDMIPKNHLSILQYLDFCKLGHYDHELGGLDSPTTNQRLYAKDRAYIECTIPLGVGWRDITYKFQKVCKTVSPS